MTIPRGKRGIFLSVMFWYRTVKRLDNRCTLSRKSFARYSLVPLGRTQKQDPSFVLHCKIAVPASVASFTSTITNSSSIKFLYF